MQARLADAESRLVSTDQSKSDAESEAENYKDTLEQQFTEQVAEYRVRRLEWKPRAASVNSVSVGASTAVRSHHSCHGGEAAEHDGEMEGLEN